MNLTQTDPVTLHALFVPVKLGHQKQGLPLLVSEMLQQKAGNCRCGCGFPNYFFCLRMANCPLFCGNYKTYISFPVFDFLKIKNVNRMQFALCDHYPFSKSTTVKLRSTNEQDHMSVCKMPLCLNSRILFLHHNIQMSLDKKSTMLFWKKANREKLPHESR